MEIGFECEINTTTCNPCLFDDTQTAFNHRHIHCIFGGPECRWSKVHLGTNALVEKMENVSSSILVINNDPNELKALMIGFSLEGFDVVGADSSSRAIQILKEKSFAAALINLMMPQMNGLQLARAIRSSNPDVRTILMSEYHLSPLQLARANTGAVGFVPKPFLFEDLVRFVQAKTEQGTPQAKRPSPLSFSERNGDLHSPFDVPKIA